MRTDEIATRTGRPCARGAAARPAGSTAWRTGKVQARHLERLAVVYVRQSSPQQVHEHRESADLQYDLRRRAADAGLAGGPRDRHRRGPGPQRPDRRGPARVPAAPGRGRARPRRADPRASR